jgi:hypothetical protein
LAWSDGSPTGSLTLMSFCRTRCGRGGRMSCWGRKRGSSLSSLQARGSLGVDVPADDVVDRWLRRPRCGRLPASFAPSPRRRWSHTGKQGVSLGRKGLDSSKRKERKNEVLLCATLTLQAKHRACCGRGGRHGSGKVFGVPVAWLCTGLPWRLLSAAVSTATGSQGWRHA